MKLPPAAFVIRVRNKLRVTNSFGIFLSSLIGNCIEIWFYSTLRWMHSAWFFSNVKAVFKSHKYWVSKIRTPLIKASGSDDKRGWLVTKRLWGSSPLAKVFQFSNVILKCNIEKNVSLKFRPAEKKKKYNRSVQFFFLSMTKQIVIKIFQFSSFNEFFFSGSVYKMCRF